MKIKDLKDNVQGMREKILDLAMRGKLVSQDENDEPASVLLEKIAQEKEQLIKEKKIKKTKPLPEISDEEKPFAIPDSWEWVRLGEVVLSTIGGGTPSKKNKEYWNGNLPWISVKDIHQGEFEISSTLDKITKLGLANSSTNLINKGTIVVAMRMAVGRIAVLKIDACINQDMRALNLSHNFYQDYLIYIYPFLKLKTSGSTVKGIKLDSLLNTLLPLPPLNEQKRIAAKIEELFTLIDNIEESLAQYKNSQKELEAKVLDLAMQGKLVEQREDEEPTSELLKKIGQEKERLIKEKKIKKTKPLPEIADEEKPFDIPDSWEWVRLGEVGDLQTGNTPTKKDPTFYNGYIPFIKPADITNKGINYKTEEFLSIKGEEKGRIAFKDSILITCIGNLGRNYYVNRKIAFNQQINSIAPILVNYKLLHYFLESNFFVNAMYREASATTLPILNKTKLSLLSIPLPPLNEQKRITTKIEELFSLISGK